MVQSELLACSKELGAHVEAEKNRLRQVARRDRECSRLRQAATAMEAENTRMRSMLQALLTSHPGAPPYKRMLLGLLRTVEWGLRAG